MRFLFINILLFLTVPALQARTDLQRRERLLLHLQARIDSVNVVLNQYAKRSDSLADQTAGLRVQKRLSFFERRKLDNLLKRSQSISQQQERAVAFLNGLSEEKRQETVKLQRLYESAIDSLLTRIEQQEGRTRQVEAWTAQVQRWRIRQKSLGDHRITLSPADYGPELEPDDMPADLKAKADFYRDRIDRYRDKAGELETRIAQVRQETTLRRRMSEMVSDVRLFDQRDEAFSPETGQAPADAEQILTDAGRGEENWKNFDYMGGVSNTSALIQADKYLKFDFYALPAYDVEGYLADLEKEKKRLLAAADSMAAVIKEYEEQAQILRQSLTEPE